MTAEKILNVFGAIVVVAAITTVVARPNSVQVIRAATGGFADSISAALGKGVRF